MLKEEFIARMGYTPTDEEYAAIEEDYYKFDGYKDAFCKAFDVKAFKSAQKTNKTAAVRRENKEMKAELEELRAQLKRMAAENAALKEALEKEQEWKTSDKYGTQMGQKDYESLVRCGRLMSEHESKALIRLECGFDPSVVEIVRGVSRMEVNRHRRVRTAETFRREPYYEGSDWNYIRFDVKSPAGTWSWEYVNGTLYEYDG